jgi:hypothetical protein
MKNGQNSNPYSNEKNNPMPETKVGFDQLDIPAPLWYRKMTNAIILCFLPVYVGFINIIPMSDYRRSVCAQVAIAIPFLLKGIAMIIGNGQVYMPSNKTIEKIGMVLLILCLACMMSCSPAKKAHNYFDAHPKEFAQDCSDAYPAVPVIDSGDYVKSIETINAIAQEMDNSNMASKEIIKRQLAEIDRLKNKQEPDCDSLSDAIYRYAAIQQRRADDLQNKCDRLNGALKNIKPVRETVVDNARVEAQGQQIRKLQGSITDALAINVSLTGERNKWKSTAQRRWWILWIVILVSAGIVFRKPFLSILKSVV